jgi:DME family drug/metabolite transporter
VLFWIAAPFLVDPAWWGTPAFWTFALIGVFFPALGQRLQIASIGKVGPVLTAVLSAFTPVFAVVIGVALLGEVVSLPVWVGIALMLAALILSAWSPRGIPRGWPLWALALPLGAALVRGIAQPWLKAIFADLPSPYFALLVGSTVSTVVLGLMVLDHRRRGRVRTGAGVRWFALTGAVNGAGILFLNLGIAAGSLSLVSPLAATAPLFSLAFGAFVFRREVLGRRHLVVAILVVVGGALILVR